MHRFFAASMSRGLLAVWSLTLAMITQGGAQATPCSIWYAPETQLPSTLGLTDTPLAPADVESSAFSVSGGSCVWIPSRPRAIRWPTIS